MPVIARELGILLLAIAGFSAAVAGYLWLFHGSSDLKAVLSNAAAAVIGLYAGRLLQARLSARRSAA